MKAYLIGASVIALVAAAPVAAQQASDQATAPAPQPQAQDSSIAPANVTAAPAQVDGIADIVVTAQRRSENAQRAAIAIDVVSPAELRQAGVVTSSTLNATAPSLTVAKAGGANTSYFIRGVGNFTVNAYADPAVAFNYDGVYIGRPTATTGTFFDLDRIEVLKGPQGTLYGRNATGGAINVIPSKPKIGELSGYGSVGYGNYNALDLEAAINLPVGANAAVRLSGKVVHQDGYNDDGTFDEVGQAGRAQFLAKIGDALTVRIAGDYSHQGGVGPGASYNGILNYAPGTPAAPGEIANYRFAPAPANLGPYSGELSPAAQRYFSSFVIAGPFINPAPNVYPSTDNTYYGFNAEIGLDTGIGTFTLIPAYRHATINSVFNGPGFYGALDNENIRQYSAELRLQGKRVGPIDWLIGGFYYDESITANYTFDQYVINVYQALTTGTKSAAAFGRVVAHLNDKVRLVGGARYTDDRKRFDATVNTLVELCTNPPPPFGPGCFGGPSVPPAASLAALPFQPIPAPNGPPVPFGTRGNLLVDSRVQLDPRRSFNRVTYKAGVEWDVGPASLLYLSYETGFRSGGFSASTTYPVFEPEYIKALTLGSKNRFLDNRAQLNLELFYWKYENQQVTHFGLEADGSTNLFTENLGKSTIKGADLDGQFLVAHNTLLRGSVEYLDNRIDQFTYTNPYGGTNLPPVTGCAVSPPANAAAPQVYTINCAGKPGYNSPKWSVNGGIEQTVPLGDYKVVLTGDVRYRSDRVVGFEQLPQLHSGDDTTLDASATFGSASDRWSITAYVRNITDVAAAIAKQFSGTIGNSISTNYAPPRTFGVRGRFNF